MIAKLAAVTLALIEDTLPMAAIAALAAATFELITFINCACTEELATKVLTPEFKTDIALLAAVIFALNEFIAVA